jgi:choline dehydrogenase-like flavoprotein
MCLDAREIERGANLDADICIVGTGAAGLAIAVVFLDQTERACLLESGGMRVDEAAQGLRCGTVTTLPYYPLDVGQLRALRGFRLAGRRRRGSALLRGGASALRYLSGAQPRHM